MTSSCVTRSSSGEDEGAATTNSGDEEGTQASSSTSSETSTDAESGESGDAGESGDSTETGDSSPVPADAMVEDLCGNGVVDDDEGEQCDGEDIPLDCLDLGFGGGGEIACTDRCMFDSSGCITQPWD